MTTFVEPFSLLAPAARTGVPAGVVDAYPLMEAQAAVADTDDAGVVDIALCHLGDAAPYQPRRLAAAVDAVLRRHEVLRASIDRTAAEPVQRVHDTVDVPIADHDHRHVDPADRPARLGEVLAAERGRRFVPADAPLLRLVVVRAAADGVVLAVCAARVLSVVVDLPAVLDELCRAYRTGAAEGHVPVRRHGPCVAAEFDGLIDDGGEAFWRETAQRAALALPAAWRGGAGGTAVRVWFPELIEGLAALAADRGVGLSTVVLAAHLKVLSMLATEPATRTDVAYRPDPPPDGDRAGCDAALHRHVLPLPVPTGVDTWRRLVDRVAGDAGAAWAHRHTRRPDDTGPTRPRLHALFEARPPDAAPVHPDGLLDGGDGPGLRVVAGRDHLWLRSAGGALAPEHVARLAGMYQAVLAAMAGDPDGDAAATYLPPGERELLLHHWAAGPVVDHGPEDVLQRIARWAERTPDAPAIRTAGTVVSYRQLEERANRIAHHLRAAGARPEALVGVCLSRTPDLLATLLGVWKAGAGYLPLDPELPRERLRHMIAAAGCPIVVTAARHRPLVGDLPHGLLVVLDEDHDTIGARPATPLGLPVDPASLAYVIYTSGSTGAPKGVMVTHDGLRNYLFWTVQAYAARGRGGAPVFSSISFDLGIPNLFTPLLTGEPVHLLPEPFDTADLGAHLAAGAPYSFIKMTPGHLDLLTYQLTAQQAAGLAGIVIAAGDSFPTALAARWIELAGPSGTRVGTEYGPTEITIGNSGQPVGVLPGTELLPLGRPIPNTTMYVLTDRLEPAPIGVPGEVCIGGTGVARGYLGRADLTEHRFRPDPYGAAGARLYRSGDLARWLPDGTLEFLGRIDNQIKIRGYRVELGEIQAGLTRHPDVRDAVVVAREVTRGDKRLVGYVVLTPGRILDAAALRSHLAGTLPDYMIPDGFVAIDRIPLTANGKVDSRALPAVL